MGTAGAVPFEYMLVIDARGEPLGGLCVASGGMPPAIGAAALLRLSGSIPGRLYAPRVTARTR